MATPSTGVGRGTGGGGKKPGAGRPKGARNRRATALIAEAEHEGKLMPVDFLLGIMRDPDAEPRDRAHAAVAAAPYCHARLTALQVMPDTRTMGDMELMVHLSRLEQQAAALPASEHTVTNQLEYLLKNLEQLPFKRREVLFRRLLEVGEAGLRDLHDPNRPGAVPPRAPREPPQTHGREEAPIPITRPTRSARADAAEAPLSQLNGRRLRYNPVSGELEPVS